MSVWLISLGVPLVVLAINSGARAIAGMPQSAAGDLLLLFVIFDVDVIWNAHHLISYSKILANEEELRAWFIFFLFVNIGLWMFAVLHIERLMHHRGAVAS